MRTLLPTLTLTGTLFLGACASHMAWTKPGVTQTEWTQDQYACERDTRMSAASFGNTYGRMSAAQRFYNKCLQAKGYSLIHKDDL